MKTKLITIIAFLFLASFSGGDIIVDGNSRPVYEGLPTNGLVLHYKLDERSYNGTALEVRDSAGTNNGTSFGGLITNPGKFDRAGVFDGVDDYVSTANADTSLWTNFTYCVWIKTSRGSFNYILSGGGGRRSLSIGQVVTAKASFVVDGTSSGAATSTSTISDNSWHFLVGIASSGSNKLYVDGILEATSTETINTALTVFQVGTQLNGNLLFNGQIDDVRIYNRALSSNEISQIYLAESYDKRQPPVILQGATNRVVYGAYIGNRLIYNPYKKNYPKTVQ